jgi:hypothetical protein
MYKMRLLLTCLSFLIGVSFGVAQAGPIDPTLAKRYFQEAQWASNDDGGSLWGVPLYGPMMFIDRATGTAVANQADVEGKLTPQDGVYVGKLSGDVPVANTAMDWCGTHWSTVMWPLPSDYVERTRLLLHESWHRIQKSIGLPPGPADNSHLSTKDGRIWLLMEYRALATALSEWGDKRKTALADAIAFRAYRRSLFPGSAVAEDRMEMNEGLAEYSGIKLAGFGSHNARYYMAGRLKVNALNPSLSYAFAYETGPSYGLLLDLVSKDWRKGLSGSSSLSALAASANHIDMVILSRREVMSRIAAYDGDNLIREETKRDEDSKKQQTIYRQTLVTGPVLKLPAPAGNYSFDPNAVYPLKPEGTVYEGCKFTDEWGVLDVSGAALFGNGVVTVSAPTSPDLLSAKGWKLQLAPGWHVVAGPRKGDFTVSKTGSLHFL